MTDMKIEDYLAQGGKLTNPSNVPARYRAELMRLMATFVDSELAGAAGFADVINAGPPGIKERIAAAKIVMEKTDNADKVLKIMGEFGGANTEQYANHHPPWADRLPRDADIGTSRTDTDMRLAVFNYPLAGWSDAVVMNLLMGLAVGVQMKEFTQVSYAPPLAEAFREIAPPVEARHAELAAEGGLERMSADNRQASVDYWWPRVAASFGKDVSTRATQLEAYGLRSTSNAELREEWAATAAKALENFGLTAPPKG